MAKKDFKNPALAFITTPAPVQEPTKTEETPASVPVGFRIMPEVKSERMQLLIKPATKKAIKAAASRQDKSTNALINEILEDYLKEVKE